MKTPPSSEHGIVTVIVAWNSASDVVACLRSFENSSCTPFDVVVVDNGSHEDVVGALERWAIGMNERDPSDGETTQKQKIMYLMIDAEDAALVKPRAPLIQVEPRRSDESRLIVIRSQKNLGFSGGNNLGIDFAIGHLRPRYILLLNSDTLLTENAVSTLAEYMAGNSDVGICSPIQYQYPDTSRILCAGLDFDFASGCRLNAEGMNGLVNPIPVEVTYVSGATLFVRTATLEKLGLLDDAMFFGAEDLDLCLRTWISGQRVMLVPASVVYHKHHVSISRGAPKWLTYYGIRSLIRCIVKNLELRNAAIAGILLVLRQTISSIVDVLLRRNFRMALDRWRAIVWNVQMIRETLEIRKTIQEHRKVGDERFLHLEDWKQIVSANNV